MAERVGHERQLAAPVAPASHPPPPHERRHLRCPSLRRPGARASSAARSREPAARPATHGCPPPWTADRSVTTRRRARPRRRRSGARPSDRMPPCRTGRPGPDRPRRCSREDSCTGPFPLQFAPHPLQPSNGGRWPPGSIRTGGALDIPAAAMARRRARLQRLTPRHLHRHANTARLHRGRERMAVPAARQRQAARLAEDRHVRQRAVTGRPCASNGGRLPGVAW